MNFDLTDEQTMLRDAIERFGAEHYDPAERWRSLQQQGISAVQTRWQLMADYGWLALPLPAAFDGLGGGPIDVMTMMEGFGRHLMLEPFVTTCVFAPELIAAGQESTARSLLQAIAAGQATVSPALLEANAGFDLHRVATTANRTSGGFRLSGLKSHAENGADADWFIVPARSGGGVDEREGISLFLVPRDAPGLSIEGFRSIDHHRHARLRLDQVELASDALLGPLDGGLPLLESAVDRTITALLAEAMGSMDALRNTTLDYLKTRKQFGVAIGTFQALQHRMVDIATACEEARSMTYHATLHLEADRDTRRRAVSAAKARVGQTALYVGRQAVQLHGGNGTTEELIVSHHLRRLMMIDLAFGNSHHHRRLFADAA
jgi:alkylation response protein AidB-like acyl-CoA dehydrogenase